MQISYEPRASKGPLLRRWRIAVIGFYGSLLALITIFAIATAGPDVQLAGTDRVIDSKN